MLMCLSSYEERGNKFISKIERSSAMALNSGTSTNLTFAHEDALPHLPVSVTFSLPLTPPCACKSEGFDIK